MSDDEADPELLELLRQSLGISRAHADDVSSDTGVLEDAEYIYNNAIDVAPDMYGTKAAAASIYTMMQERSYSTEACSQHDFHPSPAQGFSDVDMVNFIFTVDLLNFSFWSELPEDQRFQVEYQGGRWTGYKSLVACLRRGIEEGVPITTPRYWRKGCSTYDELRHVFRSATEEEIPLLNQRIEILREAAEVLHNSFSGEEEEDEDLNGEAEQAIDETVALKNESVETARIEEDVRGVETAHEDETATAQNDLQPKREAASVPTGEPSESADPPSTSGEQATMAAKSFKHCPPQVDEHIKRTKAVLAKPDMSVTRLIEKADHSAGKLVNLLAKHFSCFCDESKFDGRKVRLLKRAQIFVADLWAASNGRGYGDFHDIEHLTMFADYRVPQMLHSLSVLTYSPALEYCIRDKKLILPGSSWEVQLRGCSIWAVEMIRREILANHPEAEVNAVLIDFFLYDLAKEREKTQGGMAIEHHRTRSIWY